MSAEARGEVTRWMFLQVAEVTPVQACLVTWSHGDYVPRSPNFISVAVIKYLDKKAV